MTNVRLQSLVIQGFKSFATRTVLEFAPGVTAIVGSNGSGKTNVADAIRWVLGSQSPRAMRIENAEDVVFAGSNDRAPVGLASVELALDNEEGWLPVSFREVVVGRRAFRSGESEYRLNKSRIRLRDLLGLLAPGGLGPDGHALVAQGLADQALSLKANERRQLFEDASGVRQYRLQRTEAERKISEARRNAARVADLVGELKPRIATLHRQARQAEQESQLRDSWRTTLSKWIAHELWDVDHLLTDLKKSIASNNDAQAAADVTLTRESGQVEAARRAILELRGARPEGSNSNQLRAAQKQVLRQERSMAAGEARRQAAQREAVIREQAETLASSRAEEWEQVIPGLRDKAAVASQRVNEGQKKLSVLTHQIKAAVGKEREVSGELEMAKAENAKVSKKLGEAEEGLRGLAHRRERIRRDERDAASELLPITDKLVEQAELIATSKKQRDRATAAFLEYRNRQGKQTNQRLAAQEIVAREEHQLQETDRALAVLIARLKVLSSLVAKGTDISAEPGHGAVAATLAEQLLVPPQLETAVAASLGAALRWHLVDDLDMAGRLAKNLATVGGPRTTFAARSGPNPGGNVSPELPTLVGGRWLNELVKCRVDEPPIIMALLRHTYLVKDLDHALALIKEVIPDSGIRFVTEQGELVDLQGAITAGSGPSKEIAAITSERKRRECRAEVTECQSKRQEQLSVLQERRTELATITKSEALQRDGLKQAQQEREEAEVHLRDGKQTERRLQRDQDWWKSIISRTTAGFNECDRDEARYQGAGKVALRTLDASKQELIAIRAAERQTSAELGELRAKDATAHTEVALARQASRTAMDHLQSATARAERARKEAGIEAEHVARAQEAQRELSLVDHPTALASAKAQLAKIEQILREQQAADIATQRELQESSDRLSDARAKASSLTSRGHTLDARLVTLKERQGALMEQAKRDLGSLPTELAPSQEDPSQLRKQADRLRQRLHNLGPVNQIAIEEHASLAARVDELEIQLADINGTATRLEKLRSEVDQRLTGEFTRNIQVVGQYFQEYCVRLLGGEGRIIFDEGTADGGIELDLRLPGRRRQPLAALSGGERALASAALLFALLRARPTLFCVLDEVDAALDESNVVRFCDALDELSQETQFLVITHNRVTMERADALYGVSSSDDGVSQVISLRSMARATSTEPEKE